MRPRWFLVALIALLSTTLVVRHAYARPAQVTPDSLSAMLLASGDVNSVVGPDDSVTDVADQSPGSDSTVRAGRIFKTNKGILIVNLFENADGTPPSSDTQNLILGGSLLNDLVNGFFSSAGSFTDGGTIGAATADHLYAFQAQLNGATWDSGAVAFVKGSVYGVVLWASPVNDPVTDGTITGLLYATQLGKLP